MDICTYWFWEHVDSDRIQWHKTLGTENPANDLTKLLPYPVQRGSAARYLTITPDPGGASDTKGLKRIQRLDEQPHPHPQPFASIHWILTSSRHAVVGLSV